MVAFAKSQQREGEGQQDEGESPGVWTEILEGEGRSGLDPGGSACPAQQHERSEAGCRQQDQGSGQHGLASQRDARQREQRQAQCERGQPQSKPEDQRAAPQSGGSSKRTIQKPANAKAASQPTASRNSNPTSINRV